MRPERIAALFLVPLLALAGDGFAQTVVTRGTNLSVDASTTDGVLAMDLLGGIWTVRTDGGVAERIVEPRLPARRPRWSSDGRSILFQASTAGASELWIADVDSGEQRRVHPGSDFDLHASWHPGGERIVYASDRRGSGLDIWETDLETGLQWRLTDHPGDETEPAWSGNGRHLVYVHYDGERWSLMLRRFARPALALVISDRPLAAPSWRPDGTLITFFQRVDDPLADGYELRMVILSDPLLVRTLASGEDFSLSPVSWQNRRQLFYTSNGQIRTRGFDEWTGRTIAFRATVGESVPRQELSITNRELPLITPATVPLVIRARRLFDGFSTTYRRDADVLIEGGRIVEVTDRKDWDGITVLDLGDTTLMPGLIDAYSSLPSGASAASGALLLSWGITALASPDVPSAEDPTAAAWEGEDTPGPRLLRTIDLATATEPTPAFVLATAHWPDDGTPALEEDLRDRVSAWQGGGTPVLATNWMAGLRLGAGVLLAADALPASPLGRRYQDIQLAAGTRPGAMVSGIADAATPGLADLFATRQASAGNLGPTLSGARRLASRPDFRGNGTRLVAGSRPNGLPAGLALHAELRALQAAGLRADQVLKAAGIEAAGILGLSGRIGTISPGARADLLLIAGDPLADVTDTVNIVAVVRNGRFHSLVSLLERASR